MLLKGRIRIETQGTSHEYGPFEWWYETGPDPVYAAASDSEETAFVRVLVLPREWEGKRTIRYVDPADDEKPKLQRARIYFEHAAVSRAAGGKLLVDQLVVHGTELAFCVPGESYLACSTASTTSPIRLITCRHEAARPTWPRPTASSPAARASASSRAGRARRTRRSACTRRSRTRRR